uniref:microsomal glutathione S-transferase 3-like n=1 Tax=Styela clava TaxID=7725 RepID=UPI001939BECA|nr:microsomal glutathione S-transferase 3-like [Styela clava]
MKNVLPREYGYVALTGTAAWALMMWMSVINVNKARKKYDVPFPKMYSDENQIFNCIQRAHQNTVEQLPQFLFLLGLGGVQHPKFASACGMLWVLGRIAYAKGYYTGNPANRTRGRFGHFGMLGLVGSTVSFALHQLEILD